MVTLRSGVRLVVVLTTAMEDLDPVR